MNKYRITHPNKSGNITLTFRNGRLKEMKFDFRRKLDQTERKEWIKFLPLKEEEISQCTTLECVEYQPNKKDGAANELVRMFCKAYYHYLNINYTPTPKEVQRVKNTTFDREMVKAYFESEEWWAKPKSLSYFLNRLNEVKQLVKGAENASNNIYNFPNTWSKEREKACKDGVELAAYWSHLRALGLKAIKHEVTKKVIRWQ